MNKLNESKNADIKAPIANLQSAERKQQQQTSSYKICGGGARAARCFFFPNSDVVNEGF